ncbi:alpha/beta fold hydrolase [Pseudoxanthomonas sp. 10H]|uniref:alpha/beta fold hydrolase n=1 Tax=Pseudoxanthomonas sp. 10H TaxID=3242729 RepID=UPI0035571757
MRVPLLLLPGLLCDERMWRGPAAALATVAEPWIPDLTADDSIAAMAARVLAAAPPRFALAGLSMGGYVAFEILRQQPGRVQRLALFDTSAAPDSAERARQRRMGIAASGQGRFAGVTRQLLPRLIHARHVGGPVGREVQAMAARVGAQAYRRQQAAILGRPDSRPLLPSIDIPALVVVGADDVMTPPSESEVIAAGIRGATLHRIPDCGHLPPMEAPERTAALLRDWLLA